MSNKDTGCAVKKKTSIGGQALLEGIMMRGPIKTALAVRQPDGTMVVEVNPTGTTTRRGIARWPIVRGVVNFIDSMICGYRALMRSATLAGLDDFDDDEADKGKESKNLKQSEGEAASTTETDTAADSAPADNTTDCAEQAEPSPAAEAAAETDTNAQTAVETKADKKSDDKKMSGTMTAVMIVSVVLGFGLAIVLFKVIPEAVYELCCRAFPALTGKGYGYSLLRAAITGVLKIAILVGYMSAVSLMKDIRRTFMYHGAEHKSIFCYEKGLDLTVENIRAQRRFHPRCGTSFLILMVLVSILVTMFIPAQLVAQKALNVLARTGISLLLLPFIMGIGYELIKFAGRHDNILTRIISAPGVWLQHITTKEPTDDMIECAIAALKAVIPDDGSDKW